MEKQQTSIRQSFWQFKRFLKVWPYALFGDVVIVTGIPRSGSTLVYNIVRLLITSHSEKSSWAGWVNDFNVWPGLGSQLVLKIHDYDRLMARLPATFIHTTRDLLQVASSTAIKNGEVPDIRLIRTFSEWNRKWEKQANQIIGYDELQDIPDVITRLASTLNIKNFEIGLIEKEIKDIKNTEIKATYDPVSLMHPGHLSGAGERWSEVLPTDLQKEIEELQHV